MVPIGQMRDIRFGSKADICSAKRHFRFAPKSGRPVLANRVLPVLAIKMMRLQCREINIIDAPRVNVDFGRMRSWYIERMDAAVPAERVLGHASIKCVGR